MNEVGLPVIDWSDFLLGGSHEEVFKMQASKYWFVVITLLLGLSVPTQLWAKKNLPETNDEGMALVKDSELATVYADPGADLSVYKRVKLLEATVAFKKNWKRDQNRGHSLRVKDRDMIKIQEEVAELFGEVFTEELTKGGYEVTEDTGEDVLLVKPAIVDLDVAAPDIRSSQITRNYSERAGEMTLNIELFDSVTNDKIARATDRKRDLGHGRMQWRTSVSNRSDARRMMSGWAEALRSALDEAHSATSTSSE